MGALAAVLDPLLATVRLFSPEELEEFHHVHRQPADGRTAR
jgi:hypothetical protein